MHYSRIIPVLLLENESLVKGRKFKKHSYVGCPINAVKIFNEKEVDELIILDISTSKNGVNYSKLEEIVSESFMPIGYGGGISDLNQIDRLLEIGIEKIAINSELYENPEFVRSAVARFGSSTIIGVIDIKRDFFGKELCYINNGKTKTKYTLEKSIRLMNDLGVGEILVNDIDRDGTFLGLNLNLIEVLNSQSNSPYIIAGGAKDYDDINNAIVKGAHSVGASSCFVYQGKYNAVLINYPKI
jgi:cyclase